MSPTELRVFVRAIPQGLYQLSVLGCSLSGCGVPGRLQSLERPLHGAPAGALTRFTFVLSRPLPAMVRRICARQDPAFPHGPQYIPPVDPYVSTLLGCVEYHDKGAPAGAFRVRTSRDGVVAEGWILDPSEDTPVAVEVHRGTETVTATADQPDIRSQTRWPGFSARHGFQATLPFAGAGGDYTVCVRSPGRPSANGDTELGCFVYRESAHFYLGTKPYPGGAVVPFPKPYPAGAMVPYVGEMLDPGAKIRLNLLTAGGFFYLPWRSADLATLTADAHGHVDGKLSTARLAPGDYRLAFMCETGCTKLERIPDYFGELDDSSFHPVAIGPAFSVTPAGAWSVSVRRPVPDGPLEIVGQKLPAGQPVRVYLAYGKPLHDGIPVADSAAATVSAAGDLHVSIPAANLPAGTHLAYVVGADGRFLATAEYHG